MIFALIDLTQYVLRRGRYGKNQKDGGMHLAFVDHVPDEIVEQMNVGDMIVTQRFNSLLSWAMMYFTSSPVDHVAIYAGEGEVFHMTLSGSKIHSLRSFSKGARVFIARMGLEGQEWVRVTKEQESQLDKGSYLIHMFPPKIQMLFGALKIVTGQYPDRMKPRIVADALLTCILFYLLVLMFFDTHIGAIPLCVYLAAASYYLFRNTLRKLRGKAPVIMSHPDNAYHAFYQSGGLMFTTMGPIVVCELGLLPLKVVFRLARKRPDDSPDDKFEVAREFFSNLIEGWNLHPTTKKAEEDDPEEHKNEKTHESSDHPR
ncbi:hypothetical protein [Antarctobacter sp.]|uniref:hypothetical protein n=1 Tax=Antarctobacter sp. TaxID=1872577 RepID=UPI002B27797B|nr:hypothetical protein [Antarctobacter sp.]